MKRRAVIGLIVAFTIVGVFLVPNYFYLVSFPDSIGLPVGQSQSFSFNIHLPVKARLLTGPRVKLNETWLTEKPTEIHLGHPLTLKTAEIGQSEVELLLFGFPCRRILVEAKERDIVVPGGHAVGVLLASRGIIVVGYDNTITTDGSYHPAQDAGILPGDLLLEANGSPLLKVADLIQAVKNAGSRQTTLVLKLQRGMGVRTVELDPVRTRQGPYRIGLYVRDGANGVGTLSFYDPSRGCFGALGHVVSDSDTGTPLVIRSGSIVKALISNVNIGVRGQPGEKIGVFQPGEGYLGRIVANTEFGIFGVLHEPLENPYHREGIPVALASEVYSGPATMYTVLERDEIEGFQVEIERIIGYNPTDKGLVLKITDERLLERAGGIIQGMSGSPIIQDNRLVGIVTHVFVNDPSRGFGILAEWMLEKSKCISKGAA
jgi:stage IV sporulation protein B